MDYTTLGRTGMRVSVMGLGGGGHSRLGKRKDQSTDESVAIVRRALDRGINFIDTAEAYGTEGIVGQGIAGRDRSRIILSTKKSLWGQEKFGPTELREGLEKSLRHLNTDYVDIYHLHGLNVLQYDQTLEVLVPEMLKLKDQGKIRAVGVTEAFGSDCGHQMFQLALGDDCWDVIMVGFNILNQSARQRVLRKTREKNIGVLNMFAVRSALSQPARLRETVYALIQEGKLSINRINPDAPLDWLVREGHALSIPDAAYRFCRGEPGVDIVLSGTGNIAHLDQNIDSLERPPLAGPVRERLMSMFEGIDSVSG